MLTSLFRSTTLAAAAATCLWAAPFWEVQDHASWTAEQVQKLLHDSPWARPANVDYRGENPIGGAGPGTSRGGVGFPGGGVGFPDRGGGVGLPDGGWGRLGPSTVSGAAAFESDVVARWRSARPIQLALAQAGREPSDLGAETGDRYSISLSGLPTAMAHMAEQPDRLVNGASLRLRNDAVIRARRVEVLPRPGTPGVVFEFPRETEITESDRTVEFLLSVDQFSVRAKFKLKDMIYRGAPAL